MKSINSIDDIREVWAEVGLKQAFIRAEDFLRQAVEDRREDVRVFLVEIAKGGYDMNSRTAIMWLAGYEDISLLPLFLKLFEEGDAALKSVIILNVFMQWGDKGIIAPGDKRVVAPLVRLLGESTTRYDKELIFRAFAALGAVQMIDRVTAYLTAPHPAVRTEAAICIIRLAKEAGREDVLDKVIPLLQDPVHGVPAHVALSLKVHYPEKFPDLDVRDYLDFSENADSE
jgi:HEAT repeat protein